MKRCYLLMIVACFSLSSISVANSLLLHYSFDGSVADPSLLAVDSSPNGYNATVTGDPIGSTDVPASLAGGNSWYADDNDFMDLDPSVPVPVNYTFAFWAKPDSHNARMIVGSDPEAGGIQIWQRAGGNFRLYHNNNQVINESEAGVVFDTTAWVHVAVTVDISTGTIALYVNGVERYSETGTALVALTEGPARIGARKRNPGEEFTRDYRGYLDDFRFYDYAMDTSEIVALAGISADTLSNVDAGELQVVAMHNVTDPNVVDPNLLKPTHPAWPMAFSTNPNSLLKPQPVAVQLSGSFMPESAIPSVTWSVTDANQAAHVTFEDAGALDTNVTFDEPNLYGLTLTVSDGSNVLTDTVLVKVKLAENALQAHWKFDGDPNDPNDYDWHYTTWTGNPGFGPGLVGDALILKHDDTISYGHAIGAETSISVAFWMKPASDFASDGTGMVRKQSGTTADPQGGWTFQLRKETEMRWRCSSGWDGGAGNMTVNESFPVETWSHVVGTYDGAEGEMKFYLNGKLVGQRNTSQTCFDSFIDEFTIGSANWSGMIDDLYVFDYPLNTDEIRPLVSKGMNVAPTVRLASDQVKIIQPAKEVLLTGSVVEEGAFTTTWTVLEKPDGATVTFSNPNTLTTSVQLESVGNYRLRATVTDQGTPPLSGSDEIVVKVRPEGFDGLEAHITFDDQTANSNLLTSVPYVGTLFGDPGWDLGLSGVEGDACLLLDGVDDHINFDAYLGSDPCCTIALWIGNDNINQSSHIIQKWASDGSGKGWLIRNRPTDNPGEISPMIGSGFSAGNNFNNSGGYLPPVAWTHLALTFDGSVCSLYMNGEQFFSEPIDPLYSPADLVTPMVIGYRWNNESNFFPGGIDEVRIYDYALNAEAMEALYKADGGQ